jgi:hypothetical protein
MCRRKPNRSGKRAIQPRWCPAVKTALRNVPTRKYAVSISLRALWAIAPANGHQRRRRNVCGTNGR